MTEHQLVTRRCGCGAHTSAAGPTTVGAPVQYGPRLAAIVVYLMVAQFGAQKRVAQAVADLFEVPISQGSVAALTARAGRRLDGDYLAVIRQALSVSPRVHFDETGLRVAGRLHWVHSASTDKYSLVYVHPNRGKLGIDAGGVLNGFTGIAVHDAWAPYDCYTDATHSLCCAHLLRELVAAAELDQQAAVWARQGCTARKIRFGLRGLFVLVDQSIEDRLSPDSCSSEVGDRRRYGRLVRWQLVASLMRPMLVVATRSRTL